MSWRHDVGYSVFTTNGPVQFTMLGFPGVVLGRALSSVAKRAWDMNNLEHTMPVGDTMGFGLQLVSGVPRAFDQLHIRML